MSVSVLLHTRFLRLHWPNLVQQNLTRWFSRRTSGNRFSMIGKLKLTTARNSSNYQWKEDDNATPSRWFNHPRFMTKTPTRAQIYPKMLENQPHHDFDAGAYSLPPMISTSLATGCTRSHVHTISRSCRQSYDERWMRLPLPIHHRLSCLKPPTSHPETPSSLHLTPQHPNFASLYFYLHILLCCAVG